MKTTCIRHPEKNRYIQLFLWQVQFCKDNHCAALILAFLINWHDWKLRNDQYYRRFNDIAEMNGQGRPHSQNAYLFFTMEELIEDACLGMYGKGSVLKALELLTSLGVVVIHDNPNPRYHFDRTKHFKLYPNICNRWIAENYLIDSESKQDETQLVDYSDTPKTESRENRNGVPLSKNGQTITNTTNKNNQSITSRGTFSVEKQKTVLKTENRDETQAIVVALVEKGMPQKRFYPDSLLEISRLIRLGATESLFLEAYGKAFRCKQGNDFGVNYLAKTVEDLLAKSKNPVINHPTFQQQETKDRFSEAVYENDFSNAPQWLKEGIADASQN